MRESEFRSSNNLNSHILARSLLRLEFFNVISSEQAEAHFRGDGNDVLRAATILGNESLSVLEFRFVHRGQGCPLQ